MRFAAVCVLAAALGLTGCGIFGGDEAPPPEASPARVEAVNVQAIGKLEIGRSRGGLMLAAFGTAPGLGYSKPRLVPRREGRPAADGMLDYDFVVDTPPRGLALPPGTPKARSVRADVELPIEVVRAARGVRVHATVGGVQMMF